MNTKTNKNIFHKLSQSNLKVFAAITIIILLIYSQSLWFEFTALDDYDLILNNSHILSKFENFPTLFKTNLLMSESGVYYRPVVSFSFMIDTIIGGNNFLVFYLSNIIYHIVATFLFFFLLLSIIKNRTHSFVFTLIFAIHPALTQAVVWIPGRNDSLLFIFLSFTFIFYLKFIQQEEESRLKKILFLILSGLSLLLSLLTKENGLLILVIIFLYPFLFGKTKLDLKTKLLVLLTYLIPVTVYLLLRAQAQIQKAELEQITISLIDYFKGLINYFGKIFLPFNLSVITLNENINLAYGLVSIIVISIACFFGIKNFKIFLFGLIWFLLFLISGIVGFTGFTNFLDHRLYVPIFGIIVSIHQLKILDNISNRFFLLTFFTILIVFTYLNISHSRNFKDPLSFYRSAVNSAPNSFFTHRGLANVYHRLKDYDNAEKHYLKSLQLNPNSLETLVNIGINFKSKGNLDSSEFYFLKALSINQTNPKIHNNLGNLYLQKKQLNEAEYHLKRAIELNRNYFEAYNNLGVLYALISRDSLSYINFSRSIDLNENFAEGYFNLAIFFFNKNQIDSSIYYYNKAIEKGYPEPNILSNRLK